MAKYRSPLRKKRAQNSGFRAWWVWWRAPILLLIVLSIWWFFLRSEPSEEVWTPPPLAFGLCGEKGAGRACVVDGDTLHIRTGKQVQRIRITGYNAPELDGACEAERAKALEAKAALHAWMAAGPHEWDGGTEPPFDKYGRELRKLRRPKPQGGFEELADHMLGKGLAAESGWGTFPKDWCA
ncbi:MAG: hypothetical protein ABJP34_04545 [Erythrobacter sp.]